MAAAGTELAKYLSDKGISNEITTPDTPQHNGVAERMNRTLLDKVRTMLIDADLPESYWFDALVYAALLHNVTPTRALGDVTPEEAWSGNKPDVSSIRVFGSRAFVHIPDEQRTKLAAKSFACHFLGYARNRKAYPPTRRFLESRDVVFDEGGGPAYERIFIEPVDKPNITNNADPGGVGTGGADAAEGIPGSESESGAEIEGILTSQLTPSQTPTPPVSATSRPKRTTCAPNRDDNPRNSVSSYNPRKRPAEQARVATLAATTCLYRALLSCTVHASELVGMFWFELKKSLIRYSEGYGGYRSCHVLFPTGGRKLHERLSDPSSLLAWPWLGFPIFPTHTSMRHSRSSHRSSPSSPRPPHDSQTSSLTHCLLVFTAGSVRITPIRGFQNL
jgi:hypothetical protein